MDDDERPLTDEEIGPNFAAARRRFRSHTEAPGAEEVVITVTGRSLVELGLDGALIVDADGFVVGPLLGFLGIPGKTIRESLLADLPEGYSIVIRNSSEGQHPARATVGADARGPASPAHPGTRSTGVIPDRSVPESPALHGVFEIVDRSGETYTDAELWELAKEIASLQRNDPERCINFLRLKLALARTRSLRFVKNEGVLAEALGIRPITIRLCEEMVELACNKKWSLRELIEKVNELRLDDAEWTVFMYTLGWWDHARRG
jgi:hypothetical protein